MQEEPLANDATGAHVKRTLIPQFSLAWLLGLTVVCACILSVAGWGYRGHAWAVGVSMLFGTLLVAMCFYAALFLGVWCFSVVTDPLRRSGRGGNSPFQVEPPPRPRDALIEAVLIDEPTEPSDEA